MKTPLHYLAILLLSIFTAQGVEAEHPDYEYGGIIHRNHAWKPGSYELHKGRHNRLHIDVRIADCVSLQEIHAYLSLADIIHEWNRDLFDWHLYAGYRHFDHFFTPEHGASGTGIGGTFNGTTTLGNTATVGEVREPNGSDGVQSRREWFPTLVHEVYHLWDFRGGFWLQGPDPAHAFTAGLDPYSGLNLGGFPVFRGEYMKAEHFLQREIATVRGLYFDDPAANWADLMALLDSEAPLSSVQFQQMQRVQGYILIAIRRMHGDSGFTAITRVLESMGAPFGEHGFLTADDKNRHLIRAFGDGLQLDVSDYFDEWKFPVPDDLRAYLAQYPKSRMIADGDGDGFSPVQGDWEDNNNTVYPGAPELAGDGLDNDYDGLVDNALYLEPDEDTFPDAEPFLPLQLPATVRGEIDALSDVDGFSFTLAEESFVTVLFNSEKSDNTFTTELGEVTTFSGTVNGFDLFLDAPFSPEASRSALLPAGTHQFKVWTNEVLYPNPGKYRFQIFVNTHYPEKIEHNGLSFDFQHNHDAVFDPNFDPATAKGVSASEAAELINLYHVLGGSDWKEKRGWLATPDIGFWRGIKAGRHGITKIVLNNQRLVNGDLNDVDWTKFPHLKHLLLDGNFSGPLPESLKELPLDVFFVYGQDVTIPSQEFKLWYDSITSKRTDLGLAPGFVVQNVAPQIVTQPRGAAVGEAYWSGDLGSQRHSWELSVRAIGSADLSYQWKKDGINISGASDISLTLSEITEADAGSYTVEVTNAFGAVTSAPAVISIALNGPVLPAELPGAPGGTDFWSSYYVWDNGYEDYAAIDTLLNIGQSGRVVEGTAPVINFHDAEGIGFQHGAYAQPARPHPGEHQGVEGGSFVAVYKGKLEVTAATAGIWTFSLLGFDTAVRLRGEEWVAVYQEHPSVTGPVGRDPLDPSVIFNRNESELVGKVDLDPGIYEFEIVAKGHGGTGHAVRFTGAPEDLQHHVLDHRYDLQFIGGADHQPILPETLPGPAGSPGKWGVREVLPYGWRNIGAWPHSLGAIVHVAANSIGDVIDGESDLVNFQDSKDPNTWDHFFLDDLEPLSRIAQEAEAVSAIYKCRIEVLPEEAGTWTFSMSGLVNGAALRIRGETWTRGNGQTEVDPNDPSTIYLGHDGRGVSGVIDLEAGEYEIELVTGLRGNLFVNWELYSAPGDHPHDHPHNPHGIPWQLVAPAPPLTFGDWQSKSFEAGIPMAMRLPTANPDGDELNNAMEFLTGGDPNQSDSASVFSSQVNEDTLTLSFPRRRAIPVGTEMVVESTDLNDWDPATHATEMTPMDASLEMMTVRVPMGAGERKFIQVQLPDGM